MESVDTFYVHLEYITVFWCILWTFGNLVVIWYIFLCFGTLYHEKSGNPGRRCRNMGIKFSKPHFRNYKSQAVSMITKLFLLKRNDLAFVACDVQCRNSLQKTVSGHPLLKIITKNFKNSKLDNLSRCEATLIK
jgi:hypothetical protein